MKDEGKIFIITTGEYSDYRKLERHKFSMKKGPDRFEFHGQEFDAVIENDQVMVTDKETGETIKRK